jgi:hypothetical protein
MSVAVADDKGVGERAIQRGFPDIHAVGVVCNERSWNLQS